MEANWMVPVNVSYSTLAKCTAFLVVSCITAFQSLNPFTPWLYNLGLALSILFSVGLLTLLNRMRQVDHVPMYGSIPRPYFQLQYLLFSLMALGLMQDGWEEKDRLVDRALVGLCIYFGVLFIGSLFQTRTHPSEIP
ncbi:hypothetical protein KFE98_03660 [bacterium SCSIO 12741]|nr:hypothetical protein KFE98_03660 [bacterium SCSIO 12741]